MYEYFYIEIHGVAFQQTVILITKKLPFPIFRLVSRDCTTPMVCSEFGSKYKKVWLPPLLMLDTKKKANYRPSCCCPKPVTKLNVKP